MTNLDSILKSRDSARFGSTYTKIGMIQRRLAWPLRKDDRQIREAFHIFGGTHVNPWLIHVNVWQKPVQYCQVISLQLIKINEKQTNEKQRHCFANKGQCSQSHGFSHRHVWMWELDHKEGWMPKNWCFWTVVLEKTLESPLDRKEIKPVNLKGNLGEPCFAAFSEMSSGI